MLSKTKKNVSDTNESINKPKEAFIYLGPNVPGGILFSGSVFRDELPKHLDELFEKIPSIKDLFIEVKEMSLFKQKLLEKGTEESRLYQNVVLLLKEGVL